MLYSSAVADDVLAAAGRIDTAVGKHTDSDMEYTGFADLGVAGDLVTSHGGSKPSKPVLNSNIDQSICQLFRNRPKNALGIHGKLGYLNLTNPLRSADKISLFCC